MRAFGVRDQRDRQLVHPRITGQRPGGQLGQLAVVAARQALAHLADVLLHHVEVVEQPLARRADVDVAVGGGREPLVRIVEDAAGLVQPGEEPRAPAGGLGRNPLLPRDGPGPLGEVLGAQQLAADRAGEQIVRGGGGSGEEAGKAKGSQRGAGRSGRPRTWGRQVSTRTTTARTSLI